MKRVILLLSLTLCIVNVSFAQVGEHRDELAIGVNGGYTMSNVGFMPEVPQDMHTGLTGGLTLRYTSEKYFKSICAIVAELNFAQVGWKERILTPNDDPVINPITGIAEAYERNMTYLQIPVFARMGWGRERKGIQVFAQAGPQVGFFLGENTKTNFTKPTAGAGLEFSINNVGHFMLEGRYYYGLGDIFGNSKRDYFGRSNLTNIVIKMTYLFDIHRSNNPKIK